MKNIISLSIFILLFLSSGFSQTHYKLLDPKLHGLVSRSAQR